MINVSKAWNLPVIILESNYPHNYLQLAVCEEWSRMGRKWRLNTDMSPFSGMIPLLQTCSERKEWYLACIGARK
jgi:hypothetical protein